MRLNRIVCVIGASVLLIGSSLNVVAAENNIYQVISTNEDLYGNISIKPKASIIYDHNAGTSSNDNWITRYCWGNTQAKQAGINLSSYTRARFESVLGGIKGDSYRQWSKDGKRSEATSGSVSADIGSQYVAHTYYGTE